MPHLTKEVLIEGLSTVDLYACSCYPILVNEMSHTERQVVYVTDALTQRARKMGVSNLSKFVREKLTEYIETRESCQANTRAVTPFQEDV